MLRKVPNVAEVIDGRVATSSASSFARPALCGRRYTRTPLLSCPEFDRRGLEG